MDPFECGEQDRGQRHGSAVHPTAYRFGKHCQRKIDRRHARADPYRRKTVTFGSELDRVSGVQRVTVKKLGVDRGDFVHEYDPGNPAADTSGMVKMPNVNVLIEMADMREANRSYDANLRVIRQTRDLVASTIDLLKASQ